MQQSICGRRKYLFTVLAFQFEFWQCFVYISQVICQLRLLPETRATLVTDKFIFPMFWLVKLQAAQRNKGHVAARKVTFEFSLGIGHVFSLQVVFERAQT